MIPQVGEIWLVNEPAMGLMGERLETHESAILEGSEDGRYFRTHRGWIRFDRDETALSRLKTVEQAKMERLEQERDMAEGRAERAEKELEREKSRISDAVKRLRRERGFVGFPTTGASGMWPFRVPAHVQIDDANKTAIRLIGALEEIVGILEPGFYANGGANGWQKVR